MENVENNSITKGKTEGESIRKESNGKIYIVQVPSGREIQLIFLIKWRSEVLGLPIKSAFTTRNQNGIVFVEAEDYDVVVRAVRNFRNAIVLKDPLKFAEAERYLKELEVKYEREITKEEKKIELLPGMIVEIVDGPFKGKKARIVSLSKKKAWVDLMGGGALLIEVDIDNIVPSE